MSQPKPWVADRGEIYDSDGNRVLLSGFALGGGVSRENDAEVVRAVNCYGDLLAACERMLKGPTAAARAAAREVIKKARGE